jgi:hypothetical protein
MGNMLSLLDVLPRHELVHIGNGQEIAVFGISAGDLGKILQRFPDVFQQIAQAAGQPQLMDPALMGALLAASQRNGKAESLLGNAEAEQLAISHCVADQVTMLKAVGRCTFPEGIDPFLQSLVSMSAGTVEAMEVVVRAASEAHGTASPKTPKRSAAPATPPSGS